MKKWKYYSLKDKNEEAIGVVKANDILKANKMAAFKKQLAVSTFLQLYGVKELKNE
jgi:hypothetical protein